FSRITEASASSFPSRRYIETPLFRAHCCEIIRGVSVNISARFTRVIIKGRSCHIANRKRDRLHQFHERIETIWTAGGSEGEKRLTSVMLDCIKSRKEPGNETPADATFPASTI